MPEIVILRGDKEMRRVRLTGRDLRIGRDKSCEIFLDDPRVSRRHADVLYRDGAYVFEDAGSTHGSTLGGEPVSSRALADGDVVEVGEWRLGFVAEDGAAVAPSGTPPEKWTSDTLPSIEAVLAISEAGGESEKRLKALFEISLALDSVGEFETVLERIMDKALRIMGAERGFIMLRDQDTGGLRVHSARDREGPLPGLATETVSKSVMNKVVDTAKPVLVGHALEDPEWATSSMVSHGIHSVLCVPLQTGDNVTGVIYVDHRSRPAAFNDTDLAFFTTFAVQAKAAIDSSRAYWRLVDGLFSASDDFIAVCSSDGRVTRGNKTASELTGLGLEELSGRPFESLFTGADMETVRSMYREAAEKGRVPGRDLTLAGPEGREVAINVSGFAMRDREGNTSGLCLIGRDLSAAKRLIDDLKAVNARLLELNNMKSEFVGMLTHELKAPLSVVIGYAQMVRDKLEPMDEKQAKRVQGILTASRRLQGLIQELLDLIRVESGKADLRCEPVDLRRMLLDIASFLAIEAKPRKVTIDLRIPEDFPEHSCDKDMMRRAFENLVHNGIKYNKDGGRVTVTASAREDALELVFEDEGIGISEEDQKSVFVQFFRADDVRSSHRGTGLGLSIVKAVIERHDGTISLKSVPGEGSAFTVVLPSKGSRAS